MQRWGKVVLCAGLGLFAAGCPKGHSEFDEGKKAESLQDYDSAVAYYQKAIKADPYNANYKIKLNQIRFEAGQQHVKRGQDLRKKGDLQGAAAEFQKAQGVDPGSSIAEQELRKTLEIIAEQNHQADAANDSNNALPNDELLASAPPEIKPLSHAPISLTMSNDSKIVFDTIGKLAGLTVIYDPDLPARRITVNLNNVTLEQALDIVGIQSKTFWKPVTENIVFVIPDQPQKRRDYEEQLVRTFYLSNTVTAQDLTEIVTGLRQILELKKIQQLNAQNAIIIRDTPDKLAIAEKFINDVDKAKPEVIIQVEVLQARTDRLRDLGILPMQSASISVNPANSTTTNNNGNGTGTGTGTPTSTGVSLDQLRHLTNSDYSFTAPSITLNAILTDTFTKIIQNPEIRSVDGQQAKLKIGDRIPVATGSFSAGIGTTGAAGINPLVNTQFQYLDVGVNVDITPRVHPNHEVSMKVVIEVSSQTGVATIGGIQQPIISQRKIEHDIRLKEGEVNILAGLIERVDSKTLNGWPGLAKIPLLRYLFSDDKTDHQENEVLIVLVPRIVRMPEWSKANLRSLYSGSEANIQVRRDSSVRAPNSQPPAATTGPAGTTAPAQTPAAVPPPVQQPPQPQSSTSPSPMLPLADASAATSPNNAQAGGAAKIRFEPQSLSIKPGQTVTVGVAVDNVNDLFSIPMLLQYNPAVISVEEVQHGGFLSGGTTQEIAIVQRVDKEHGQAIISATRQPNTPGVNGSGTLMGIVIKGIAPGSSNLSIVQVNAKDSQQKPIPLVTSEATVQVQP